MSLVTVAQLKAYARKADADTAGEALYQVYLDRAEALVVKRLGYAPASASRTETLYGDGKPYLDVAAPIISLTSITIDGVAETLADWTIDGSTLTRTSGEAVPVGSVAVVVYSGGWATIPPTIIGVILELATMMLMRSGENIGVNSRSFDGGDSRVFANLKDYEPYLADLDKAGLCVRRLKRTAP